MPIVGLRTASGRAKPFDPTDTLWINSGFAPLTAVQRLVGVQGSQDSYSCTSGNKKDGIEQAGCVPTTTTFNPSGHAIRGPVYAGIGPPVELRVPTTMEPGTVSNPQASQLFSGTVTIRQLTPGFTYRLHAVTATTFPIPSTTVPTSPTGTVGGTILDTFIAITTERTIAVNFQSNSVVYYICVRA